MSIEASVILIILSAAGFSVSLSAHRERIRSHMGVCATDEPNIDEHALCDSVLHSPRSKIIGTIPNTLIGMLWYALLCAVCIMLLFVNIGTTLLVLLAAACALIFLASVYLALSLLFVERVFCLLCYTAHGINAIILAVMLFELFS